jgi:hypothetical protein
MKCKVFTVLAAVTPLALPAAANAARLSWFDDVPARDSLGQVRAPFPLSNQQTPLTFGVDAYRSLVQPEFSDAGYGDRALAEPTNRTLVKFYGEIVSRSDDFRVPLTALDSQAENQPLVLDSSANRLSGFGVKWQHRVDATNTVALSAGYSEIAWSASGPNVDTLDTRAAVSWSGSWSGAYLRPGVSGSVFVGDETARDETYQQLGRRYYGFSVGGELQLAQDHTPYFSYRLRRDLYSSEDPTYLASSPYEDRSQISAGWRWQVQRNWSLQAEARYGLNGANLDPYSPDRSRFFFGTRFDFR